MAIDFSNLAWFRPKGNNTQGTYALCSNGKVIYIYNTGNSSGTNYIYQAFANTVDAFTSSESSVSGDAVIFSHGGFLYGTVFNIGADLYLQIAKAPFSKVVGDKEVLLYKSPSGNGGDWTQHGTVRLLTGPEDNNAAFLKLLPCGASLVLPGGRWVTSYPHFKFYGGHYLCTTGGVATSDDGGVTWTNRLITGGYLQGTERWGQSLTLGYYDSAIYYLISGNVDKNQLYRSVDGTSWTLLYTLNQFGFNGYFVNSSFFTCDGYLYMVATSKYDNYPNIIRTVNPTVKESWELVKEYPLKGGALAYYNFMGNRHVLEGASRVSGVGEPGNIRYWTGTEWKTGVLKEWDGATWVVKPLKFWTGTEWKS